MRKTTRKTRRPAQTPRRDIHAEVTARITERLAQGTVPWQKPWRTAGLLPTSATTGRSYRGINLLLLSIEAELRGYGSPYWLTFRQAQSFGGSVRKGEKGTLVVFYRRFEVKDDEGGPEDTKSVFVLRNFTVFNLEQTDDVTLPKRFDLPELEAIEPDEGVERIIAAYPNPPKIQHRRGDSAHYEPARDIVTTPDLGQFSSAGAYAETILHELTHSTGHAKRLDRFATNGAPQHFGSERYAREELVAEMGAAMLAASVGIELSYDNAAAYIANWLQRLNNDHSLVLKAASQAQRAVDLILGTSFEQEEAA